MSLFFYLFAFAINLWHRTSLQCLSTIDMAFSDENKTLIKLYGCTAKKVQMNFDEHKGIKIGALKIQFVYFFHIS